ncbi:translation initiation factor IF-2-like [Moschus berezovskii]|uniref:translation initiation factor IF-2-like n=1 Tax=Moschus berezovskii TaxID=68408 RepID=UPI002445216D|nr:translation initiation factor IF-2-like [Moschus berezovskii]
MSAAGACSATSQPALGAHSEAGAPPPPGPSSRRGQPGPGRPPGCRAPRPPASRRCESPRAPAPPPAPTNSALPGNRRRFPAGSALEDTGSSLQPGGSCERLRDPVALFRLQWTPRQWEGRESASGGSSPPLRLGLGLLQDRRIRRLRPPAGGGGGLFLPPSRQPGRQEVSAQPARSSLLRSPLLISAVASLSPVCAPVPRVLVGSRDPSEGRRRPSVTPLGHPHSGPVPSEGGPPDPDVIWCWELAGKGGVYSGSVALRPHHLPSPVHGLLGFSPRAREQNLGQEGFRRESGGGPAPGAHDGGSRPAPRPRPPPARPGRGGDQEVLKAIRPRGGPASEWDGARPATAPGPSRARRVSAGRAGAEAGAPSAGSPPPRVSRGSNREGDGGAAVAATTFPRWTRGRSGGCAWRVSQPWARGRAPPRAPPPVVGGPV